MDPPRLNQYLVMDSLKHIYTLRSLWKNDR